MTRLLERIANLLLGPRCPVCGTRCAARYLGEHADTNHPGEVPR